jgi:hypothetical protein
MLRRLDLDHVGAKPREGLGARSPGLELREVDHCATLERAGGKLRTRFDHRVASMTQG